MTALVMTVLIGVSGLGVELGYWYTVKHSMQGAADSGAIEAALSYVGGNTGGYAASAKSVTAQNGWSDGSGAAGSTVSVSVNTPPANGSYASSTYLNKAFEVVISRPQKVILAWAVGFSSSPNITVHSVALITTTGNGCILALSTSSSAITVNGNGNIAASNCGVDSNGSINFNGTHSTLSAASVAVGSSTVSCPSSQCVVPSGKVTKNTTTSDPYSSRGFTTPPDTRVSSLTRSGKNMTATTAIPHGFAVGKSVTVAGATNSGYNGTFTIPAGGVLGSTQFKYSISTASGSSPDPSTTITACEAAGSSTSYAPAIYCGGTINAGNYASDTVFVGAVSVTSNVTFGSTSSTCPASPSVVYFEGGLSISNGSTKFCPGLYYIEGGSFTVSGQANITGTAVTFILTTLPWGTASYATANIAGQGATTLSAPTGSTAITLPDGTTATEQTGGLVFFQDRNAPISASSGISVGGNGTISLTGAIYSPKQTVTIAGNGVSGNANTCTQVVALDVIATGNGTFSNNCTGDGTQNFGTGGSTVSMAE